MGRFKNTAVFLTTCLFFLCAGNVRACAGMRSEAESETKPRAVLKIDDSEIEYKIVPAPLFCNGGDASGCTTRVFSGQLDFTFLPSGRIRQIHLTLKLKNTVSVVDKYRKGSCLFDHILKHELTHVNLGKGVMKKYAPEAAKAVLARLDSLPQPLGREGQASLSDEFERMLGRMDLEAGRQDALIDGNDNYEYQWSQALQVCSEKERKQNGFNPEVVFKIDKGKAVRVSSDTEKDGISWRFYFSWDFDRTEAGNVKTGYLTAGLKNIRINLPSDVPENSCAYNYALRSSLSKLWLNRYLLVQNGEEMKKLFASHLEKLFEGAPVSEYKKLEAGLLKIQNVKIAAAQGRADISEILRKDNQDWFDRCQNKGSEKISRKNVISEKAMKAIIKTLEKPYQPKREK